MINVLYILDYGTLGGATKAFITLVQQMQKFDVNPIVVTGQYDELNVLLEEEGIKTIAAGHVTAIEPFSYSDIKWPLRLVKYYIRYFIKEYNATNKVSKEIDFSKIDVIHTNSARSTLGCRLAKRFNKPHVVHIREFGDKDFDCVKLNFNYIHLLNRYTTLFLSVSNAVRSYWNSKGIDPKKNVTVYDGVHYEDISISLDEEKKTPKLRMVINGGVCIPKAQHLIIEAMAIIPSEIRDNLSLDIAGWGNKQYINDLLETAQNNGFGDKVKYLGSITDVHQRIGTYQIGLMCSRSEGFGLVTAEYMHGRLGVIASNAGACPELIEDGVSGLLFKTGDAKSLADCMVRLYNNRELLISLSNAAQDKAKLMFTQQKNAESIYDIYKKVLNK